MIPIDEIDDPQICHLCSKSQAKMEAYKQHLSTVPHLVQYRKNGIGRYEKYSYVCTRINCAFATYIQTRLEEHNARQHGEEWFCQREKIENDLCVQAPRKNSTEPLCYRGFTSIASLTKHCTDAHHNGDKERGKADALKYSTEQKKARVAYILKNNPTDPELRKFIQNSAIIPVATRNAWIQLKHSCGATNDIEDGSRVNNDEHEHEYDDDDDDDDCDENN